MTTAWMVGGLPLDVHVYPTPESYVGEHLVCWLALMGIVQLILRLAEISPFVVQFKRAKSAIASYLSFGLSMELVTTRGLWWLQVNTRGHAAMWMGNSVTTGKVLAEFIVERLITWGILFCVVCTVTYFWKGRARFLNQPLAG
jgi:hypothetical protein